MSVMNAAQSSPFRTLSMWVNEKGDINIAYDLTS